MSKRRPKPPPEQWDIANQLGNMKLKEASSMDILFLLDATWSMRIHRNVIVEQLEETIKNMVAMFQSSCINVGVVAYRDTILSPLVEELKFRELADAEGGGMRDVINWLKNLKFHSGIAQDVPEDVHTGLERAASKELGWSSRSRAIIHIADAPGHGRRLACCSAPSKYTDDDQPDFDMDGAKLKELLRKLKEDRKVNEYAFIHALTTDSQTGMRYKLTEVMVEKMREACGDPAWIQEFDWCEDDFRSQMYNVASTSRQRSLTPNPKKRLEDAPREHVVVEKEPDWDDVEIRKVTVEKHQQISSINGLVLMIQANKHLSANVVEEGDLKRAPDPFAQGQSRLVYYGMYRPNGKEEWEKVVLKELKSRDPPANTGKSYRVQLETHTVASFLAEQFNKHASELPSCVDVPEVKFLECSLVCIKFGNNECFMLKEPWRSEKYVKFNGKNGYVNLADIQPHFQAFSHWTYVVTGEWLMVVDMQGFKVPRTGTSDAQILVTDPAIYCYRKNHFNPAFGKTHLLALGPQNFLLSHASEKHSEDKICGSLCKALLPDAVNFRLRQSGGSYRKSNANEESSSNDFAFTPERKSGLQSFQPLTPAGSVPSSGQDRNPDPMQVSKGTNSSDEGKNSRHNSTPPVPSVRPSMSPGPTPSCYDVPDSEPDEESKKVNKKKKKKKKNATLNKDPEQGPPTPPPPGSKSLEPRGLPQSLSFPSHPEEPQPAPEPRPTLKQWLPRSDTPTKHMTEPGVNDKQEQQQQQQQQQGGWRLDGWMEREFPNCKLRQEQGSGAVPLDQLLHGWKPTRDDECVGPTSSAQERLIYEKAATAIQDLCSKMLEEKGLIGTPEYLFHSIELCFELGLISTTMKEAWHEARKLSNIAKHCWTP